MLRLTPKISAMINPTSIRLILITALVMACLSIGNFLYPRKTAPIDSPIARTSINTQELTSKIKSLSAPVLSLPSKQGKAPIIYARSYIVIDHDTKYPLALKDADVSVPIASTTKIMTALLTLETLPLDKTVVITKEAAATPGSQMNFITGEKHTTKNLLYALMLNSANDAAVALSQANGPTSDFVNKMNEKATLLGLKHTHYADPAGLEENTQSSPRDLVILMDYALNNKTFRDIVGTQNYTIWSVDNVYKHDLKNSNRLIHPEEPFYFPNAIGGKTGFTFEAGHCLITAAETTDGKRYVAAVLHTNEDTKEASAREVRKLLTWAISQK